ncbi:hypothetical protein B0T16DRAFT_388806 [Cercophora newfieldiana]|uniref:Uncharacterized protein n=1 Tax=Cercophora newfieldiana TaxID=92897 RepID=A0AA39YAY7_9PEZI|nr:hypothetical protein B0T16DRAFT_388806 [Cercophora newfieldiana]
MSSPTDPLGFTKIKPRLKEKIQRRVHELQDEIADLLFHQRQLALSERIAAKQAQIVGYTLSLLEHELKAERKYLGLEGLRTHETPSNDLRVDDASESEDEEEPFQPRTVQGERLKRMPPPNTPVKITMAILLPIWKICTSRLIPGSDNARNKTNSSSAKRSDNSVPSKNTPATGNEKSSLSGGQGSSRTYAEVASAPKPESDVEKHTPIPKFEPDSDASPPVLPGTYLDGNMPDIEEDHSQSPDQTRHHRTRKNSTTAKSSPFDLRLRGLKIRFSVNRACMTVQTDISVA